MTTKRSGDPWMSAADYGRTLNGLSLNLLVREMARSLPFYTEVLGFTNVYSDTDFAALEREGVRITLHADHTYDNMPWWPRLAGGEARGLGAEIRLMGIDPDAAERAARKRGFEVLNAAQDWPHGWRDAILVDPDGYTFGVGVSI